MRYLSTTPSLRATSGLSCILGTRRSNRGWILGVRQKSGRHIQVTRTKGYRWGVIHAVPDTLLRAWNTCLYVFLKAT